MFANFAVSAVIFLAITSVLLIVSRDWRLSLTALSIQYVGVFILVAQSWTLEMAVVKLVAGWIGTAVLGIELVNSAQRIWDEEKVTLSRVLFRLFFAVLVGLVIFSVAPEFAKWMLRASYSQILGGLILMAIGSLHLGLSAQPFRIILGLLTVFSGFEILFCTLETSPFIAGGLSLINLGLSLVGAYLLTDPDMEISR
jgi:hypothetical protein